MNKQTKREIESQKTNWWLLEGTVWGMGKMSEED